MIIALAALVVTPIQTDAASIVSKMLGKYHTAETVSGKVVFTQTAPGARVVITSDIYVQKPNMFSILQTRQPAASNALNQFLAVGDGKRIGYPAPPGSGTFLAESPDRFFEAAGPTLESGLQAFSGMLLDRSLPVAVGLYSPTEIHLTIARLRSLKASEVELADGKGWRIDFQMVVRDAIPADPSRNIPAVPESRINGVMTISKDHDLRGLAWHEKLGGAGQEVEIRSEWQVTLDVGKPIPAGTFRVR